MFQFTTFPPYSYVFTARWLSFSQPGFPIRKSPDRWLCAPPRSLSQLFASFIGSWCQGIHLMLLLAWPVQSLLDLVLRKLWFNQSLFPRYMWIIITEKLNILSILSFVVIIHYGLLNRNNSLPISFLSRCRCVCIRFSRYNRHVLSMPKCSSNTQNR